VSAHSEHCGRVEKVLADRGKVRGNRVMPNMIHVAELHVVVQFGGSSKEQYLHTFSNEEAAHNYIRKADRASYRCLGPFAIILSGVRQLADATERVIARLEAEGLHEVEAVMEMTTALVALRLELSLR